MKSVRHLQILAAGIALISFASCSSLKVTHVRPGQSARAALAGNDAPPPSPEEMPTVDTGIAPVVPGTSPNPDPQNPLPGLPTETGPLPTGGATAESVADAYTRGTFAMQAGQNAEAITALEEAVKLDPDFTDAWGKLAILYQKDGQSAKATDAFKKAKRLGDANGGTVTRDSAGGLQFP
jgi:hypothetical protein